MRITLGLVAWLSVVVPVAILAGWGASFLTSCVVALAAGGSPIVYTYDSPGGKLTARADSYRWSIPRNTLQLRGIVVRDPDQNPVVEVNELFLEDFVPGAKPIRVRARDVTLRVERKADGSFRFLDWAPPATEEPTSEVAYSVDIGRLSVLWEDHAGGEPWRRWVSTPRLRVDGRGGSWMASGRLKIEHSGYVGVALRGGLELGVEAEAKFDGLEVAELLKRFARMPEGRDFPELKDLHLSQGRVWGPMRLVVAPKKPVRVVGKLRAETGPFSFGPDIAATSTMANVLVSEAGLRGELSFADGPFGGDFRGTINWEDGLRVGGAVTATTPDQRRVPKLLRAALPNDLGLRNVVYTGWIDYREPAGWTTQGTVSAHQLTFGGETVQAVSARLSYEGDRLLLNELDGSYATATMAGALALDLRSNSISGHLSSPRFDLGTLARRLGLELLEGTGEARLAVTGKLDQPSVELRATGRATSRAQGYDARLGRFEVAAQLRGSGIEVDRLTVVGPSGTAYARGEVDLEGRNLGFDVLATSVPLRSFFEAIQASAAFSGRIEGSFDAPYAEGQLELFGAQAAGQKLPYARGNVLIDRDGLEADEVLAFKRGATARGAFGLSFGNLALSGNFTTTGVNLADYPPEGISGIARINQATLAGTLESPILEADIAAETLVVSEIRFGDVTARAKIKDRKLAIENVIATSESGQLSGSALFSLDDESGTFDFFAKEFALAPLVRDLPLDVALGGTLDGRFQGSFAERQVQSLTSEGQLTGLRVNQAFLGNGPLTLTKTNGQWDASLFLGDLNAYVEVPKVSFDESTRAVSGDVIANNFDVSVLYKSFRRYLNESGVSPDVVEKLDTLSGELDLSARLSGTFDQLDLQVPTLAVGSLKFEGQDAGVFTTKFARTDRVWTVDEFLWKDGPVRVSLSEARIEEEGEISIDGEINDLDWSWFAALNPLFARIRGETDLPFLVRGPTRSPEIQASLSYDEAPDVPVVRPWPGTRIELQDPNARARRIDLDTISIRDGEIVASGAYNVDGFTGPIEANIPFRYPFEIPADREILARLTLPDRPLYTLTDFLPGLDVGRTEGSVRGQVIVRGLRDDLKVTGSAEAKAKQFAYQGLATTLQDLDLQTRFNGETATISATAKGSEGGTLAIEEAGVNFGNLADLFQSTGDTLVMSQLFGSLQLSNLKVTYNDPTQGPLTATLGGGLLLGGNLRQPEITGQLLMSAVNAAPPSTLAEGGVPTKLPIDPRFNISILATDSMRLRMSTGNFFLGGSASLTGTLSEPDFTSTLIVERGSIRLPNARINIEPGGEINITYRAGPNGIPVARAEIDMVGRTQVSAESFTGNVERYDVILTITGDLLQENGLQLSAQSDPPDLSQDRILAILGQGDVLGGRRGETFRADRQLQSALIGIALPYVAGGLTERLADQLGLDYLNVEYNTFDQLSVTAAMSLGRDLVLSGRRQISNPLPGFKPKWEVRLSYRPPFRNRALRRFSFSIGMDQDRPWKIMVEYGIRF